MRTISTTLRSVTKKGLLVYGIGFLLATTFFFLNIVPAWQETIIWDELAHIPASYSYVKFLDYRLNPEHPPLIKEIAGLPLLFLQPNFPTSHPAWEKINGQWEIGRAFLFEIGNDADQIVFFSRLSLIITWSAGIFLFFVLLYRRFSLGVALISSLLLAFSPTFLAHGHYVTTDVGVAFFYFFALLAFEAFLRKPTFQRAIIAGIVLGLAQLSKFSAFLLYPILTVFSGIWIIARTHRLSELWPRIKWWTPRIILIFLVSFALVWAWYTIQTLGYPPEKQARDTAFFIENYTPRSFLEFLLYKFVLFSSDKPLLRGLAHYLLGLIMVIQRVRGGNSMYFMGQVTAEGWLSYFPLVYLLKEPLGFHILSLLVLGFSFSKLRDLKREWRKSISNYPFLWLSLLTLSLYWLNSISSKLNLGVRHLTPVLILTFSLVGLGVVALWRTLKEKERKLITVFVILLLGWNILSVLSVFPNFLTYFNFLGGGPDRGYLISVDSNYDWGQDLKRLRDWLEKNNIEKIYLDYYGTASVPYYLGEKAILWWGKANPQEIKRPTYFAVSASSYVSGRATPVKGFPERTDHYWWLDREVFVARVGSILVFWLPQR